MALIKQVSEFEIEGMGDLYYGQIQKAYVYYLMWIDLIEILIHNEKVIFLQLPEDILQIEEVMVF